MKFFLTCFFVALYLVRPFEYMPLLYGSPILLICGCLGLLSVVFSGSDGQAKWCETDTFMLGFFVAILFSHASHFYLGGVITSFEKFLPIFLGYFLISHSIVTRKQVIFIIHIIVVCTCFIAVEGWLEHGRGISYFGVEPLLQSYQVDGERLVQARIKWLGPFSDPNDLALLFVIPIPLLLARFKQSKVFALVAGVLLIMGIYYTNSRGGMLSLVVAIFVYFVLRYRNKTGLMFGVILGLCLLVLGPSRMGDLSVGESSAYGRIDAWYHGFQMFKQSPIFGVGMGMYTDFNELTAHNSFVLIMSELGLFGLFFFTGLFWVPVKKMKSLLWGEQRNALDLEDIALVSSLAASLAAVMTAMFFLSRSYILVPYLLLALSVRLSYVYEPGGVVALSSSKTIKEIALLTILGIAFVFIFTKVLL